jgi:hypothetical protein
VLCYALQGSDHCPGQMRRKRAIKGFPEPGLSDAAASETPQNPLVSCRILDPVNSQFLVERR